jgi:CRISPR-associated endonuclease/helicase Cas3
VLRDAELAALLVPTWELLAKSARIDRVRGGHSRIRAAPENFRHEALSVALAEKHPEVVALDAEARDLVLWLVGTHHGFGRPFFPPCRDPAPETQATVRIDNRTFVAEAREAPLRLDQGWFERAQRVNRRHGPWELARLEAILRLADHAASAEEQGQLNRLPRELGTMEPLS